MIDGVHFNASLPLGWQTNPAHGGSALESARYLAVLAEFEQNSEDRPRESQELHAKLDLTLLWLARSFAGEMPQSRSAWVGLESLFWLSPTPLAIGEQGRVLLNLSEALPFLLNLPAQAKSCVQQADQWLIGVDLQLIDEHLCDWWERTVFRRHRRIIQKTRGQA